MALTQQQTDTINLNIDLLKRCRKYDFYSDLEIMLEEGANLDNLDYLKDQINIFDPSLQSELVAVETNLRSTSTTYDGLSLMDQIRLLSSQILNVTASPWYYYVIYKYILNFRIMPYVFDADIFFYYRLICMDVDGFKQIYCNPQKSRYEGFLPPEEDSPDFKYLKDVSVSDFKEKCIQTVAFVNNCPGSMHKPTLLDNTEFNRIIGLAQAYVEKKDFDKDPAWWRFINTRYGAGAGFLALFIRDIVNPLDKLKCYCLARVLNTYMLNYARHPLVTISTRHWSYVQHFHNALNDYTFLSNYTNVNTGQTYTNSVPFINVDTESVYTNLSDIRANEDERYPNFPETDYGDIMEFPDLQGYFGNSTELNGDRNNVPRDLSFKLYDNNLSIRNLFDIAMPLEELKQRLNEEVTTLYPDTQQYNQPFVTGVEYQNMFLFQPYLQYYFFKINKLFEWDTQPLTIADGIFYLHSFFRDIYGTKYASNFHDFYNQRKKYAVYDTIHFDLERRELIKNIDNNTDPLLTNQLKSYLKQIDTDEFIFLIHYGRHNATYIEGKTYPKILTLNYFNNLINSNNIIKSYIRNNVYSKSSETLYFEQLMLNLQNDDYNTYEIVYDCQPLFKQRVLELIDLYNSNVIMSSFLYKDNIPNYYLLFEHEITDKSFAIKGEALFKLPKFINTQTPGIFYNIETEQIHFLTEKNGTIESRILPVNFKSFEIIDDYMLIPIQFYRSLLQDLEHTICFKVPPLEGFKYNVKICYLTNKSIKKEIIKPVHGYRFKVLQENFNIKRVDSNVTVKYYYNPIAN